MSALVVEVPGFLTTVQDIGRPGFAALGISASGAADPIAFRAGNRLVGNSPHAAALEMTLVGGRFRVLRDAIVALAGADPRASAGGRLLPPWTAHRVRADEVIACGPLAGGARSYLCVRGGIAVPLVFGSASTHLASGLGGCRGRALRAGDRIELGTAEAAEPLLAALDPGTVPGYDRTRAYRATWGPQADAFGAEARDTLVAESWAVSEACDRMGIRLEGPPIARDDDRDLLTEGVALGGVQVPPDGRPIVLFVEHQTTGGYPKVANVIAADLARLGQLRPRDRLRFEVVTLEQARAADARQEEALGELLA